MLNIKYTDSAQFRCLENLEENALDLYMVHTGKEHCLPLHICSGTRAEYIIHFVLSGKGSFSVKGNTYVLTAGQMFLISPDIPVTYAADEKDPWYYAWIGFHGIRAEQVLKHCGFSKNIYVTTAPSPEIILDSIERILDAKQLTLSNDLRRKACMNILFAALIDHHAEQGAKKYTYTTNTYVEHAVEYIKYNYQTGINVGNIADYIGISRTYLNHAFQKELGLSIQKFLIDYRLHKASSMLVSTSSSIHEIAASVGYEDPLAFSKAFKKKFEMSPKNYREKETIMDIFTEKQPPTSS